jgi:predicted phosphodiesterase
MRPGMRVAALYDIHANLPALEAVIGDVRLAGVDLVLVGGDVLPGPMPRESLEYLLGLDLPVQFIVGNGDREVLERMRGHETGTVPEAFRAVMRWNAAELEPRHGETLAGWPATTRIDVPGLGQVLFCHATPRNDTEIFTRLTPEAALRPIFSAANAPLVVCGHTHMQFDRTMGDVRVVNAGSVGMPFGEAGAYWLLLGPDVALRRTSYDLVSAAERIRATNYPHAMEFAERNVLHPPAEADMLQAFSRGEVK